MIHGVINRTSLMWHHCSLTSGKFVFSSILSHGVYSWAVGGLKTCPTYRQHPQNLKTLLISAQWRWCLHYDGWCVTIVEIGKIVFTLVLWNFFPEKQNLVGLVVLMYYFCTQTSKIFFSVTAVAGSWVDWVNSVSPRQGQCRKTEKMWKCEKTVQTKLPIWPPF